jgi:hypothetical protein
MTTYSMYEREDEIAPAAVGDRFSWFAALLPPVYAAVHGMWWELLGWGLGLVVIAAAAMVAGGSAAFWLYVLFAIWIGFEAAGLRRNAMRRRGWAYGGEIVAGAEDLAIVEWLNRRTHR